jgi:hypothetical protein
MELIHLAKTLSGPSPHKKGVQNAFDHTSQMAKGVTDNLLLVEAARPRYSPGPPIWRN